tara:strand:+ start:1209 stop:1409 length:201 start_codon:yes stop_codon:yes gene_type:complete
MKYKINEYYLILEDIMIAIGNNEPCPFCKGDNKFINNPDVDLLEHLMIQHPMETNDYLFGGKNIGL